MNFKRIRLNLHVCAACVYVIWLLKLVTGRLLYHPNWLVNIIATYHTIFNTPLFFIYGLTRDDTPIVRISCVYKLLARQQAVGDILCLHPIHVWWQKIIAWLCTKSVFKNNYNDAHYLCPYCVMYVTKECRPFSLNISYLNSIYMKETDE